MDEEKKQYTEEYTGEYGNIVKRAAIEPDEKKAVPDSENAASKDISWEDHKKDQEAEGKLADESPFPFGSAERQERAEGGYIPFGSAASREDWKSTAQTGSEGTGRTISEGTDRTASEGTGRTASEGTDWTASKSTGRAASEGTWDADQSIREDPYRTDFILEEETSPKKKSFGRRLAGFAGAAVLFGALAAACFQGVCYFSTKVLGVNLTAASADIDYTTENVTYTNAATDMAIGTADVSGIVQQTMPAIVSITSTSEGEGTYDLFGQYYEGQDTTSAGTGFIVGKNNSEMLIATNNHVVDGAKAISVQFADDEVYDATLKGNDSSADLAVVAVKLKDFKPATLKSIRIAALGDSTECKVGEMVVAIGNALGYGQSVTVGYVSARDREIQAESEGGRNGQATTMKVIQTDAAINPGNSGGPLINMRGEVIGINSAKIAASAVEGVGYSIPISEANPIIDELMNREVLTDAQKGYLGIAGKTVTEEASAFNMPEGVYVNEVAKGSGAEKAGIQQGDIITAINDIKVTTIESLAEKANSYKKGTKVTITLKRSSNGTYQEKKVEVVLQGESSISGLSDGKNGSSQNDRNQKNDNDNSRGGHGDDDGSQDGYDDGSDDSGYGFWGNLFPDFGY